VILGHLTENILRNSTQYETLLYHKAIYGFKPRFILDEDGALELVPLPTFTRAEFEDLVRHPDRYLEHEYFIPGGPAGTGFLRFPYTLSVLSVFRNFHIRAELARRPFYSEFYEPDHPSQGLQVTTAILTRFQEEAKARGKRPLVLIIPTGMDFEFQRDHEWVFQSLLDRLTENGVDFVNVGEEMLRRLEGQPHPCKVLFRSCSAHFNARGYALLAEIVDDALDRRGIVQKPPAEPRPGRSKPVAESH
jgi:hypothetical protein